MEEIDTVAPTLPQFGAVVCTQSLNHLLDPRFFFEWSYRHLTKDGILVLEVMNFRHQLRRAGRFRNAVKIDHVHMFVPEVLREFVTAAGFDILYFDADEIKSEFELRRVKRALPTVHMTLIGRRSARPSFAVPVSSGNYRRVRRSINPLLIYLSYLFSVRLPKFLKSSR